jgi:hypothetical protein
MWSFLSFERFIAQDVLIFFYYMFALVMPLFLWSMRLYILKKVPFLSDINSSAKNIFKNLTMKQKVVVIMIFVMIFFCMELCLRMMFEMFIGYFDMHNYLQDIAEKLS